MADTAGARRRERKKKYVAKFELMIQQFKNVLICGIDNVGSLQMQKVRRALRGRAELMMGKNTLMRMIIRKNLAAHPKLEALLPLLRGNVGLVFTNDDLAKVRNTVVEYKVPAAAKAGTFAPGDVFVPPGPTGLDPGQTGFFQALNIATKIARGSIEIIAEVHLLKKGDKITSSTVALLNKLDIKPFFYGITVSSVYENGSIYPVSVLDITQEEVVKKFLSGVAKLTGLSLGVNYPCALTLPHYIANAFRKLLAISLATGFSFKEADAFLKAASEKKEEKQEEKKEAKKEEKKVKKEEPKEEPVEEDTVDGMGGLFG